MLGEKYHDEHDQFDHLHVSSRSVAFDEEYTLGQELGTGAMSVVRMAEHKHSGRRLAVKCIANRAGLRPRVRVAGEALRVIMKPELPPVSDHDGLALVDGLPAGPAGHGAVDGRRTYRERSNECARVAGSPPDTVADRTAPSRRRPRAGSRR